ncbi:carboxymuconolactone decarboxylase family protein [Nocardia flavorosea]|uniref:Carboxymuconolactone decarboxylase family protein n=1 Tax=Nocardia flavorosea TaxID=53429 RepID=A0A846YKL1_9NOCA|nr:carboxymuconolactone decarboxylase family protein [Nocardia flavorosea]NKY58082.1 carboxymuconolactone decarboxylase family protein [Nocardia flavorosea]
MFDPHTPETAPEGSRATMTAMAAGGGAVPDAVARLAASPELLTGFLDMTARFDRCTLEPIPREVVIMTVAVHNDCHICIAIHAGKLRKLGAAPELAAALREKRALDDEHLDAVRVFTLAVMATAGAVDTRSIEAFLAHGYTERNALEVVLGVGTYTISTFANRLVRAA